VGKCPLQKGKIKMHIKTLSLVLALIITPLASAQITKVEAAGTNVILGVVPAGDCFADFQGTNGSSVAWSTVPYYSLVTAGTPFTLGLSSPGEGIVRSIAPNIYMAVPLIQNGSARATIRGAAYSQNQDTPTSVTARFTGTAIGTVLSIVIWGPTLNQFGVTGAQYFSWTVLNGGNVYSGNGETTLSVTGDTVVTVTATYHYENGDVLIQANTQ
jgi:hypothetical protein